LQDDACAAFRTALKAAIEAAEAGGMSPEVRIALVVTALGDLVAASAEPGKFQRLLDNVQRAIEHAAWTAQRDPTHRESLDVFVERWLN